MSRCLKRCGFISWKVLFWQAKKVKIRRSLPSFLPQYKNSEVKLSNLKFTNRILIHLWNEHTKARTQLQSSRNVDYPIPFFPPQKNRYHFRFLHYRLSRFPRATRVTHPSAQHLSTSPYIYTGPRTSRPTIPIPPHKFNLNIFKFPFSETPKKPNPGIRCCCLVFPNQVVIEWQTHTVAPC